jgi:hypothetical protein
MLNTDIEETKVPKLNEQLLAIKKPKVIHSIW